MREFIVWWIGIEAVGLAAFPLTFAFFGRLPDRGFAFCKVVGLLLLGYGLWAGSVAGLFPNSRGSVVLVLFLVAGLSLVVVARRRRELAAYLRSGWRYVAFVEAMFFIVLAAAVYIRSFAPDIIWGEKQFELAFLNAVNRAEFFPPEDPWLAGHSISYYYFGYVMVSALSKLVALGTEVTFYLSLSLTAALAWVAVFGLVYNMIAVSRQRGWVAPAGPPLLPRAAVFGLAASFLVIIVSNLAGVFELMARHGIGSRGFYGLVGIWDLNSTYDCSALPSHCREWYPTQYWWWWKATRMGSEYDIQEFPFFSFHFGDLHPHVLLMPFLITAFAVAFQVLLAVRGGRSAEGARPARDDAGAWWLRRPWPALAGTFAVGSALLASTIATRTSLPVTVALPLIGAAVVGTLAYASTRRAAPGALDATWWLRNPGAFAFIVLLFGGIAFIDTWGVVLSWLLLATAVAVVNWLRYGGRLRAALDTVGFVLPLAVIAYLLYLPYWVDLASPVKGLTVTQAAATFYPPPRSEVTRPLHFLLFWTPALWAGLSFIAAYVWGMGRRALRPSLLAPAAALWLAPLVIWAAVIFGRDGLTGIGDEMSERGANVITVLVLALFITATGVSFFHQLRRAGERDSVQLFAFNLAGFAFIMLLGAEFFYVNDLFRWRANTVFRFWHQGWIVMGIVGGFGLYRLTERWRLPDVRLGQVPWHHLALWGVLFGGGYTAFVAIDPWNSLYSKWWTATMGLLVAGGSVAALAAFAAVRRTRWTLAVPRLAWVAATAVLFAAALVYPVTVTLERTGGFRNAQRMDGLAYAERSDPQEAEAIRWLRENVSGTPVVLEAVGADYSDFGRVSGRTGLPTVMGWLGHELQWRGYGLVATADGERIDITDIQNDVATIYTTDDVEHARELMAKYDVQFVYAGAMEREQYGAGGFEKFRRFMVPVFENESVTVYRLPDFRPVVAAP